MRVDIFSVSVQNEKRSHSTEQWLLKMKNEPDSNREGAFPLFNEVPEDKWLVDSGASSHMTPKREYFGTYWSFSTNEKVALGDGRVVEEV